MLDSGLRSAFAFGPTGVAAVVGVVIAVMKWRTEPVVARMAVIGFALLLAAMILTAVQPLLDVSSWSDDERRTFLTGVGIVLLVLSTIAWVLLLTALFVRLPQRTPVAATAAEPAEADGAPTGRHVLLDDSGQPVVAETGAFLARPRSSPGFPAVGAGAVGAGAIGAGAAGAAFGTGVFGEPRSTDGPPDDALSPEAGATDAEESPTQTLPVVGRDDARDEPSDDDLPDGAEDEESALGAVTPAEGQAALSATDAEAPATAEHRPTEVDEFTADDADGSRAPGTDEDTATRAIPTPPRGASSDASARSGDAAPSTSTTAPTPTPTTTPTATPTIGGTAPAGDTPGPGTSTGPGDREQDDAAGEPDEASASDDEAAADDEADTPDAPDTPATDTDTEPDAHDDVDEPDVDEPDVDDARVEAEHADADEADAADAKPTAPPVWQPTRSSGASGPLPTRTAGATGRVPAPFATSSTASGSSSSAPTVPGQGSSPAGAAQGPRPPSRFPGPPPPAASPGPDHHPWFTPTGVDEPGADEGADEDADVAEETHSTPTGR